MSVEDKTRHYYTLFRDVSTPHSPLSSPEPRQEDSAGEEEEQDDFQEEEEDESTPHVGSDASETQSHSSPDREEKIRIEIEEDRMEEDDEEEDKVLAEGDRSGDDELSGAAGGPSSAREPAVDSPRRDQVLQKVNRTISNHLSVVGCSIPNTWGQP